MTPGTEPALTPDEWLSGVNRGKGAGAVLGGRHGDPKNGWAAGQGHKNPLTPSPVLCPAQIPS